MSGRTIFKSSSVKCGGISRVQVAKGVERVHQPAVRTSRIHGWACHWGVWSKTWIAYQIWTQKLRHNIFSGEKYLKSLGGQDFQPKKLGYWKIGQGQFSAIRSGCYSLNRLINISCVSKNNFLFSIPLSCSPFFENITKCETIIETCVLCRL